MKLSPFQIKKLKCFIAFAVALYLIFCFAYWDCNPKHWNDVSRAVIGVFLLVATVVCLILPEGFFD